jgi:hypothetical protein
MDLTREQLQAAIERARAAGRRAAEARYLELTWQLEAPQKLIETCGGAVLVLRVDGRTKAGKLLRSLVQEPIPNASITRRRPGEYLLHIQGMSRYQGQSVNQAAETAALATLKEELGVDAYVKSYLD